MAPHRSCSRQRRLSPGRGAQWTLALTLLAAAGLAGCGGGGGDDTHPFPDAAGSRILIAETAAGQPQVPLVSKPVVGGTQATRDPSDPAVGVEANPSLVKPPVAPRPAVPLVFGKVRYGIPAAAELGVGGSLLGAVPFLPDDDWNRDVARWPADPSSDALIAAIGATLPLQAAFGPTAGIPYVVVGRDQPSARVRLDGEADGEWPLPEGAPVSEDASRRLIVLDRDQGLLYELRGAARAADGAWLAIGGSVWRLDADTTTPLAAAPEGAGDAGIPLFAGLLRPEAASAGVIRHALRVTVPWVGDGWRAPARGAASDASTVPGVALPPVGLRLRLKPEFEIAESLSLPARAILQALKTYGMIVVGTGPAWAIEGSPDASWDVTRLAGELGRVRGEHLEVVQAPVAGGP